MSCESNRPNLDDINLVNQWLMERYLENRRRAMEAWWAENMPHSPPTTIDDETWRRALDELRGESSEQNGNQG